MNSEMRILPPPSSNEEPPPRIPEKPIITIEEMETISSEPVNADDNQSLELEPDPRELPDIHEEQDQTVPQIPDKEEEQLYQECIIESEGLDKDIEDRQSQLQLEQVRFLDISRHTYFFSKL